MAKRLRILAGPNGSGKSSVYAALKNSVHLNWGVFVNADEIEKQLREQQYLDITDYGVGDLKKYGHAIASHYGNCMMRFCCPTEHTYSIIAEVHISG